MTQEPTSPLLEALSSLSIEHGSRNRFTAEISRNWTTQLYVEAHDNWTEADSNSAVLGGYLNALMLSATQKYLELEFGPGRYPHPIHVFVQFLNMVSAESVVITCHTLRTSSRQCVVRVESSRSTESQSPTTVAIITYGDLSKEKGISQDTKPVITTLPNRHTECVPIDDPVVDATPVTRQLHWIAPNANNLWGHRLGGHYREVWLSPRDGSKISSVFHLAVLADMPLQPPATHELGFYTRYALSTLCLSVEFKKIPHPDTRWVMTRSHSNKVSNGRYDVNVQILDESGELLALSNHVAYIVPLRPPPKPKASKM